MTTNDIQYHLLQVEVILISRYILKIYLLDIFGHSLSLRHSPALFWPQVFVLEIGAPGHTATPSSAPSQRSQDVPCTHAATLPEPVSAPLSSQPLFMRNAWKHIICHGTLGWTRKVQGSNQNNFILSNWIKLSKFRVYRCIINAKCFQSIRISYRGHYITNPNNGLLSGKTSKSP